MKKRVLFKNRPSLFTLFTGLILATLSFGLIFLFGYAFVNSFKGLGEYIDNPLGMTEKWEWKNYEMIFYYFNVKIGVGAEAKVLFIEHMILNTLLYSIKSIKSF